MSSFFRFKSAACDLNYLVDCTMMCASPARATRRQTTIQQINRTGKAFSRLRSFPPLIGRVSKLRLNEADRHDPIRGSGLSLVFSLHFWRRRMYLYLSAARQLRRPSVPLPKLLCSLFTSTPTPKARELKLDSIRVHWTLAQFARYTFDRSSVVVIIVVVVATDSVPPFKLYCRYCYSQLPSHSGTANEAIEGVENCLWMRKARCHINKSCAEESTLFSGQGVGMSFETRW